MEKIKDIRKVYLSFNLTSELKIREAISEVENLGADEKLTEIIVMLSNAKDLLSEYIDEKLWKLHYTYILQLTSCLLGVIY